MTLNKDRIFIWIQAAGNILCELLERAAAEIRRRLAHGDRVHIRHHIIALILIGKAHPVLNRAQVGAERQSATWLDSRENDFFLQSLFVHFG